MTLKHSENMVMAKARIKMSRSAPDYPPLVDYDCPIETITITRHWAKQFHVLEFFPSRRNIRCFRIMVDGKLWSKSKGYDRALRGVVKSLSR